MRKIIVSQFIALDGIIDAPEKWNSSYAMDAEVVAELTADLSVSSLILFGKTTYEFFAARWPARTGEMADYFNRLPKIVISSSLQKAEWNNTTLINTDAIAEIKNVKEQSGENILVVGSHKLVQTLMKENLIDEYKLYLYPLTLGNGKRLFEPGAPAQNLKLIACKQFASGVIAATYQTGK